MGIEVSVFGQVKHKQAVTQFASNVLGHFFDGRLKRPVSVNIRFCKNVLDYTHYGLCDGSRNYIDIYIAKMVKSYETNTIEVVPYDEMMITVAHELVHAKQFIRNEINPYTEVWRKDGITIDCTGIDVDLCPWEQEAMLLESELYNMYWESNGKISKRQNTIYYW